MKAALNLCVAFSCLAFAAAAPGREVAALVSRDSIISAEGIVLEGSDRLSTPGTFRPPVEITIVAKTDSTNLRLAYAADQIIFNWENDGDELRVDGGPANGLHQAGRGRIPAGKYVTIRWVVTPKGQSLYVDKELRFEHRGDYSAVDKAVSIFPAAGSVLTVKSLRVKPLDTPSR